MKNRGMCVSCAATDALTLPMSRTLTHSRVRLKETCYNLPMWPYILFCIFPNFATLPQISPRDGKQKGWRPWSASISMVLTFFSSLKTFCVYCMQLVTFSEPVCQWVWFAKQFMWIKCCKHLFCTLVFLCRKSCISFRKLFKCRVVGLYETVAYSLVRDLVPSNSEYAYFEQLLQVIAVIKILHFHIL